MELNSTSSDTSQTQVNYIRRLIDAGVTNFIFAHTHQYEPVNNVNKLYHAFPKHVPVYVGTQVVYNKENCAVRGNCIQVFLEYDEQTYCAFVHLSSLEPSVVAIEHKIDALKPQIDALETELKIVNSVSKYDPQVGWVPEHRENYYYLEDGVFVRRGLFGTDEADALRVEVGNCFKSQEIANAYLDAQIVMTELRRQPGRMRFAEGEDSYGIYLRDGKIVTGPSCCFSVGASFANIYFNALASAECAINVVGQSRILAAFETFIKYL